MEDEYFVANGGRFAAVFDGHGGSGVSAFLKAKLYDTVTGYLKQKHWEVDDDVMMLQQHKTKRQHETTNNKNAVVKTIQDDQQYLSESDCTPSVASHVAALRAGFEQMERDVIANDDLAYQGSTAVAVVLHESDDGATRTLLSANVGDSRAILSRKGQAVDLTRDHKPNDEREKKRILAMGETIEWDSECMVHRVRNLSLARAIGDRYAKPAVSPEVEIQLFPVQTEDEFVVLASDGLWDVMTSQDVVSFVHKYMDNEVSRMSKDNAENYKLVLRKNMAKVLAREAIRKGSTDNICVLMVWL